MTRQSSGHRQPRGELTTCSWAMPTDMNPIGSIFGGWIMSQMDAAGAIVAEHVAQSTAVTIAVDGMSFLQPIHVGDVVRCYTEIERVGRTSICLHVEVWISRKGIKRSLHASEAKFTFVAIDDRGKPRDMSAPECYSRVERSISQEAVPV